MKLYSKVILGTLLMAASISSLASEKNTSFSSKLSGFNETPPIISNGSGTLKATLDKSGTMLNYTLTFSALATPVSAAHIHFGHNNSSGGVVAFLCGGGSKPTCPASGGTISGTIIAADVLGVPAQGVTAGDFNNFLKILNNGKGYVNIHTTMFPTGEIRGQITKGSCA